MYFCTFFVKTLEIVGAPNGTSRAFVTDMGKRRIILAAWLVVGYFYFFIANEWISASMNDRSFTEYIGHVLDLAVAEHRPPKEVRSMLLVRAESLEIPIDAEQIRITGEGRTMRAIVEYETDVRMPLINRPVYRIKFSHDVQHKDPR
jgi:uncharacterized ubiquitin-like protein YukD